MPSRPTIVFRAACLMVAGLSAHAQQPDASSLRLPSILSDHMVLQAGQEDPLWGWAPAGTAIKAEFLDAQGKGVVEASGTTTTGGKWRVNLPVLPSGTAGQLRITAGTAIETIQDVLVGETWLCGGQSNMSYTFNVGPLPSDMPADMFDKAKQDAAASQGMIRAFTQWNAGPAETPQDDAKNAWIVVKPDNFQSVSCVAFYFAVALREKLNCPMGLIVSARPGTLIEQWMSKAALDATPTGPDFVKSQLAQLAEVTPKIKQWQDADDAWAKANPTPELQAVNKATRPVRHDWPPPMFSQLYNGMTCPLEPYGIKGVLWFQADGDLDHPKAYGDLIKALIANWRQDWGKELPFYYVEMNNMRDVVQTKPVQLNDLSILREQQAVALTVPGVDVACSIDVGLPEFEPHFPNKRPVGERLALLAEDHLYNLPCVCHSPAYDSFVVEGNRLRVHFKDADGLRVRGSGEMKGFAIKGATGDWAWAQGQVDGKDVLLSIDSIPQPTAARYAWAMNPITSMENGAGLPLRPFRTDTDSPQ